jgi:hypothetical protein
MTHAQGGYETKDWDEQQFDERQGEPKFTRVQAINMFHGDLDAESHIALLMVYPNDNFCSFTGLERVSGRLGGREGSFVLQQSGTYEDGAIKTSWFVVPGSATGDLTGLRGTGGYEWNGVHGVPTPYTLDYDFGE